MSTERPTPPPPFIPPDEQLRREYELPLLQVQGAVILAFVVLGITILMGFLRSRVSNPLMKTMATVVFFPMSNKLLSYIPGAMDLNHKYDLFAFWLAFLTYLNAVANNYSCYRFGDNEDRRISLFMDYIFPWGTIAYSLCKNLIVPDVIVPVLIMFWMVFLQFRERRDALSYATRSSFGLMQATKVVSDFLRRQRTNDVERVEDGFPDVPLDNRDTQPNTRYLVGVRDARSRFRDALSFLRNEDSNAEEDDNKAPTGLTPSRGLLSSDDPFSSLVTLDQIVNQKDTLVKILPAGQVEKLQDTCFSFSLFWMLLAKVAGHDVRTDARRELVGSVSDEPTEQEVQRIFDVIATEIDFLYQYFYTNYFAIYIGGLKSKILHLGIVLLFIWLTLPLFFVYRPQDHSVIFVDVDDRVVDSGITRFVILVVLVIELVHIYLVLTSKWAKIIYLCDYIRSKRTSRIAELALRYSNLFSISFRTRKVKIAQYSLLGPYNSVPKLMWLPYLLQGLLAYIIQELLPEPSMKDLLVMHVPRVGRRGVKHITLDQELQKTFVRFINKSIKSGNGKISNGATVLTELGARNLLTEYVHKLESHSEVILVWHLATHHLENVNSLENTEEKRVAITLSKYCAYLAVFATKFLPDNAFIAQCAFTDAVMEFIKRVDPLEGDGDGGGSTDVELTTKPSGESEDKYITEKANALKYEILNSYNDRTWKLLAGFWTEFLLYISLGNNFETIEAHADYLCTGGELVTHLWALLNHAGCTRDPEVIPKIMTREDE